MKNGILLVCVLLFFSGVKSQPLYANEKNYVDSLIAALHSNTATDTIKTRICILLSAFWVVKDATKSEEYLNEGKKWSGNNKYLQGLMKVCEGNFYYPRDAEKSKKAYQEADSALNKYNSKEAYVTRSNLWAKLGALHQRDDDDAGYVDIILHKAIPLALAAHDSDLVGGQYTGIGVAFMNLSQNEDAETYFNKAILILQNGDRYKLSAAYNRAGENYYLLKKFDKVKEILMTNRKILASFPNSPLYAGYYMLEGLYAHENKRYKDAVTNFDKGIAAADGLNKYYVIQELNFYKLESLLADKQYDRAKILLNEMMNDDELMSMEQNRVEIYKKSAILYAGIHRMDSAFYYQQRYSELSDSLHEDSFREEINKMAEKYQSAEKEKKILSLQSEKEKTTLTAAHRKTTNKLLIITCAFLVLLIASAIAYYRQLSRQKEHNHQQQLKDIEQQQQLKVAQAMLEGEERERARVAQDLHDGLGGMLAGVKINLSGWANSHSGIDEDNELDKVIHQLDNSVGELRRIARNMMPVTLLRFGLLQALEELCDFYRSNRLKIEFQQFNIDKAKISLPLQLNIYRIIQELLFNAVKHSGADNIVLQCSHNENVFFITIEDNGKGFDPERINVKKGMGLSNIRNRIDYLKGTIEINSSGEGTGINIEFSTEI